MQISTQITLAPVRFTTRPQFKPFSAPTQAFSQPRVVSCAASTSREQLTTHQPGASTTAQPSPQNATMPQRLLTAALAASLLLGGVPSAAVAIGPVSVKLEDLQVSRTDCGAGISSVGGVKFSGAAQKAACLAVSAQASNPSNKPLYNADVFGRVYDVNGEAAIDDTENIRIAYIDEIPPGQSNISFKLNVPLEQFNLGPLKLTGFKATGFPGKMLPKTAGGSLLDEQSQSDCEITGDCEDIEAAAAIR